MESFDMRNLKNLLGIVAALLACVSSAKADIAIAVAGPMTGQYAPFGEQFRHGAKMAVADINAAGGVLGKQIELIVEDTQGRPPTGATVVEKLITQNKVVAAAGEYHSSVCKAEIEVFHQHGIPFVIGSCWSDSLTKAGYDEVFRTSVYSSKLA